MSSSGRLQNKERRCKTPRYESVATYERPPHPLLSVLGPTWEEIRGLSQWGCDHRAGKVWDTREMATDLWRWWRQTWAANVWGHHARERAGPVESRKLRCSMLIDTVMVSSLHHTDAQIVLCRVCVLFLSVHAVACECNCLPNWGTALWLSPVPRPLCYAAEGTESG